MLNMAAAEDGDEASLLIRFILPKGKTETTCSEDLGYAFDQAQDHDMSPTWMDEKECIGYRPVKTVSPAVNLDTDRCI